MERVLKQQHQTFAALMAVADAAVIATASYVAWFIRVSASGEPLPAAWESWFKQPLVLFTVPLTLIALSLCSLYKPRRDKRLVEEFLHIARASMFATGALIIALWSVGNDLIVTGPDNAWWVGQITDAWAPDVAPARIQIPAFGLVVFLMLVAHRSVFRLTLRYLRSRGWNIRHVAVVGVGRLGQIAARTLERNSWAGLSVAYFVSHHDRNSRLDCLGRDVHGGLADLEAVLEEHPVDAVYLAVPQRHAGRVPELLRRLERFAVDVRIVPDVAPRYLPSPMAVSELDGMPILTCRECPTNGLGGITKRALDVAGAAVAIVLFAPLMALIALLVRISGPGRVIFKQRRVGLNGETFKIYKFRTMAAVPSDDDEVQWTKRNDPRITPIGRFLRQTSLDELPQLVNVLQGRMSLVGPRPERPELVMQFREDWRGYMLRQHVKAGMTGWAQVNGLRGDTSLKKRLQYDLFYIRNWSLLFDVRILLMTFIAGFVHRNAH
ncbi:MAG: undecaprenyl-phosphate glucose phosphotransferase [Planctomycetota bacterium]